jgi:hypothetical protein
MTDPCAGYLQVLKQQSQGRSSETGPGYTSSSVTRPCSRSARLAATAAAALRFTEHHCVCRPSPFPTAVCLFNLPFLPSLLPLSLTPRFLYSPPSLPSLLPLPPFTFFPLCCPMCCPTHPHTPTHAHTPSHPHTPCPRPDLTTEERELLVQELLGEVTALWQTDEIRRQKPTPVEGRCGKLGARGRTCRLLQVFKHVQHAAGGGLRPCELHRQHNQRVLSCRASVCALSSVTAWSTPAGCT